MEGGHKFGEGAWVANWAPRRDSPRCCQTREWGSVGEGRLQGRHAEGRTVRLEIVGSGGVEVFAPRFGVPSVVEFGIR